VTHHPFQRQMGRLVECIRSGRESHCNLLDAAITHEVVFAALKSERSGRPVALTVPRRASSSGVPLLGGIPS